MAPERSNPWPIRSSSPPTSRRPLRSFQRSPADQASAPGLTFDRHFTKPGINPFDEVTWEHRDAVIMDWKGKLVFEQKAVEVPADWSVTATNIVASKYLHGQVGTP